MHTCRNSMPTQPVSSTPDEIVECGEQHLGEHCKTNDQIWADVYKRDLSIKCIHVFISLLFYHVYYRDQDKLYTMTTALQHLTAKLFNWNFYPLEVVSRWRGPQLQVSENYSDLT